MKAIKNSKLFQSIFKNAKFIQKHNFMQFLTENVGSSPFIFIMMVGPSQLGKSTLGNWLSNSKGKNKFFEVGVSDKSITSGADIAYAGRIGDILNNTGTAIAIIEKYPHLLDQNYHVFLCDTEGIQSTTADDIIASFVFPLIQLSAKIVYFLRLEPDNTKAKFLDVCLKVSEEMRDNIDGESMFDNKLIVRVRDHPVLTNINTLRQTEEEDDIDPEYLSAAQKNEDFPRLNLSRSIERFKNGDMARFMRGDFESGNDICLPIECAPGGPWHPTDERSKQYNEYLISLLFNDIRPEFVFTPQRFCDSFFELIDEYKKHEKEISAYLRSADFKETSVNNRTDRICQEIDTYFRGITDIDGPVKTQQEIESYKKTFYDDLYRHIEKVKFERRDVIEKCEAIIETRFKKNLTEAMPVLEGKKNLQSISEEAGDVFQKRLKILKNLSKMITDEAKRASELFFDDFRKSFIKFSKKQEAKVDDNFIKLKIETDQYLDRYKKELTPMISSKIQYDIDQIWEYFQKWRNWLPFQKSGFMNWAARTFHNNDNDTYQKPIPNHRGMIGIFKKEWHDQERCRGIIIQDREYEIRYRNDANTITVQEANQKFLNSTDNLSLNILTKNCPTKDIFIKIPLEINETLNEEEEI